jgi:hypothetical protein
MIWDYEGLTIYVGENVIHVEWITVLAFLLVFVAVFLIGSAILKRAGIGGSGMCRWRRVQVESGSLFSKWKCRRCDVEAFTTDKRPPKECKRLLEGPSL